MNTAKYYREQAYRALMLAQDDAHGEARVLLAQWALDVAEALEAPSRMDHPGDGRTES